MRPLSLVCSSLVAASLLVLAGCPAPPKQVGDVPSSKDSKADESSESSKTDESPKTDETPKWEGAVSPEPPKPTTNSGGNARAVNEAPTRRKDQYDRDATEVVLKRAARQVKENCGAAKGEDGKASGPWGKASVQLQLGSNGRSKGVTVPSPYQGKPTGNCVEKAFANLTYPPWGGADAQIDWEIELVNPAAEATKK